MTNAIQDPYKSSIIERHVQTVLLSLITAALIGGFVKGTNMSDNIIIIKEQAIANREIINEHSKALLRLQANDAAKTEQIIKLEIRLQDLKDRIEQKR